MIRTASPRDLPALRELFARSSDAPYDLAAVAEEKCFGLGYGGEPLVRVIGDVDAAAVTCGRYVRILVVDRDKRRQGLGSALLADSQADRIAAEPGNYFTPGIVTSDDGSFAFLKARGYVEKAWTTNMDVQLPARRGEGWGEGRNFPESRSGEVAPLTPALSPPLRGEGDDRNRILDFIEREFGKIWRFEASKAFDREEPTIFIAEEQGEIAGFAAHDVNNRGLGWFGPTGVAQRFRGRGIGRDLLLASLADLSRLGYEKAVIPWTDAIDFYRKSCGAKPAHRFVAFEKPRP